MTLLTLPPSPADNDLDPPIERVIYEVVRADGDLHLAAERLACTRETLLLILSDSEEATQKLAAQFRILSLISAFQLSRDAHTALQISLGDLEVKDLARTYTSLVSNVAQLSDKQTLQLLQTINTNVGVQLVPWDVTSPPQTIEQEVHTNHNGQD